MPLAEARARAEAAGLDLVEVARDARPPVVRLLDAGKYFYALRKKQAAQRKSTGGQVKGIRIGFQTSEHDWQMRLRQAQKFLAAGYKVRLEMRLRGRENQLTDRAQALIKKFISELKNAALEGEIMRGGRGFIATLVPRH
jgi:translation initiation factor IF-3